MATKDTVPRSEPLFRKVDCVRIEVPDLESGLGFYRHALGHELIWRSDIAAGLRLPDSNAEIVLHCDGPGKETDFAVDSVPDAIDAIVAAGGKVLVPPFDIQIGKCAVVLDPWGNELTILDSSKGQLLTDPDGNVTGNASPEQP